MKKTIFVFINWMDAGGAERVVSLLLQEWKDRYQLKIVLLNKVVSYHIPPEVEVIELRNMLSGYRFFMTLNLPFLAYKYKRLCKKQGVSVSLSFLKRPNYIACLSRLFGNKSGIIISERSFLSLYLQHLPLPERIVARFLSKRLYRHADIIIANSHMIANDLQKKFSIKGNYRVVHNPVDPQMIARESRQTLQEERPDAFCFIHAGGFRKEKNQAALIEAFHRIRHLNVRLYLLGQGPGKAAMQRKVKRLNLENQVIFPPFDTNPFKYFTQSNCFVLSSKFEGFPNTILESMACGLPVIATDCYSGPREILAPETPFKKQTKEIEFGQYGILVPVNRVDLLAQSMEMLAGDPQLQQSYRQKSLERVKDFEVKKQAAQFVELIESLQADAN